jgi:ketosteroid isomerase-like protein
MTVFVFVLAACIAGSNGDLFGQTTDSASVVGVVASFHAALRTGDSTAALRLLDREAMILESGDAETRAEYRSHHLPEDIKFARTVQSKESILRVSVSGSVAWVASTTVNEGAFERRRVSSAGAELVVLKRTDAGWKIAAIHWSSRARKLGPVGRK